MIKKEFRKEDRLPNIVNFVIGAGCIALGARLLVENGAQLALVIGVPESIVGVTFVAIGTSLPELITAVTAIKKKQASISVGNIIGANVIDLTLILPLCTIVSGRALPISHQTALVDLPACLIVLSAAVIPVLVRKKFSRVQGVILILLYTGYLALLVSLLR